MVNKPIITNSNKDTMMGHLMNQRFVIPEYQRFYEWDDGLITQFLKDIEYSIKRKMNLFIGVFIFKEDKRDTIVIDGQQRIITFLVLLRSLIDTGKLDSNEKNLVDDFLKGISMGSQSIFSLNEKHRRIFFERYILNGDNSILDTYESKRENITRIENSKKIFDDELIDKGKKEVRKIWHFCRWNIEMTFINITNDAEEADIFESINAKKLNLNDVDLMKNYFLSKCKKQKTLGKAIKTWDKIHSLFGDPVNMRRFLDTYFLMKYGKLDDSMVIYSENKLYHKFTMKKDIYSSKNHLSILNDIHKAARWYHIITVPNQKDWPNTTIGKGIFHGLNYLAYLKFETPYPLILKIVKEIDPGNKYILSIIKLCEINSFIRIVVFKQYPQDVKDYYYNKLKRLIRKKSKRELKKIITEINKDVTTLKVQEEVIEDLKNTSFTQKKYITYLLYRVMLQKMGTSFKPGDINTYKDKSIEHILPKSLSTVWKNKIRKVIIKDSYIQQLFFRDFSIKCKSSQKIDIYHKHFLNLLGNCSLLSKVDNSITGNRGFEEKKKIFKQKESSNPLFRDVINKKEWDHTTIDNRSERLIKDYFGIFS